MSAGSAWQTEALPAPGPYRRVLVVEDVVETGAHLDAAAARVRAALPGAEVRTAAVLVHADARGRVDAYAHALRDSAVHVFEWNLAHAELEGWGPTCADMDGVLVREDGSGLPRLVPNFTLQAVVTSRPESRRAETEAWLREHGVRYGALVMDPGGGPRPWTGRSPTRSAPSGGLGPGGIGSRTAGRPG